MCVCVCVCVCGHIICTTAPRALAHTRVYITSIYCYSVIFISTTCLLLNPNTKTSTLPGWIEKKHLQIGSALSPPPLSLSTLFCN